MSVWEGGGGVGVDLCNVNNIIIMKIIILFSEVLYSYIVKS